MKKIISLVLVLTLSLGIAMVASAETKDFLFKLTASKVYHEASTAKKKDSANEWVITTVASSSLGKSTAVPGDIALVASCPASKRESMVCTIKGYISKVKTPYYDAAKDPNNPIKGDLKKDAQFRMRGVTKSTSAHSSFTMVGSWTP